MKSPIPILSSSFFPSVQYFAHLFGAGGALIEANDHYQKKTFRNRYMIYAANGVLTLSVPVESGQSSRILMKDVRVAYDTSWNDVHWKSIEAAYNSSPYFLYYEDDIRPIFEKKWKYLFDMNIASIEAVKNCLGIELNLTPTTEYHAPDYYENDLREIINPKNKLSDDKKFTTVEYRQVFGLKYGFAPNLSILDLLFNKGNETLLIFKDSFV